MRGGGGGALQVQAVQAGIMAELLVRFIPVLMPVAAAAVLQIFE